MKMSELSGKTLNGVKWTASEQIASMTLQFIIGIMVARCVSPSDYGLIAMLGIFMSFGDIFINSGFSLALIRKKEVSQQDYSTALIFNIIVGILIYLIIYVCAPFIAAFYKIPELNEVTRLYALSLLIGSFAIVQMAKLTRELKFKIQFYVKFASLILSGAIGIGMAYAGYGVWALVWQGIILSASRTLFLWSFSKWTPMMSFSTSSFRYLFSFGSRMLATNIIDTIYDNIYTLVIGKFYTASSAGYYNRSLQISQLPQIVLSNVVCKVALPILSPYQDNHSKLLEIYEKLFRVTVFFTYPLMALIVVLAAPIIYILLGNHWLPSTPYLQILSVSVVFVSLTLINLNLIYVKGRSDLILKMAIVKKIIGFAIVIAMTPLGLKWICSGTILYACAAFIINCSQTKKILNYGFIPQLKSAVPSMAYSLVMGVIVYLLILPINNYFLKLLLGLLAGIIVYVFVAKIMNDKTLNEIICYIKQKYGKQK